MEEPDYETKEITVLIGDKPYPLLIAADTEREIRQLVRQVNETVNDFQIAHPDVTQKDCMAMSLLTYAAQLQQIKNDPTSELTAIFAREKKQTAERLNSIEALLDNISAGFGISENKI